MLHIKYPAAANLSAQALPNPEVAPVMNTIPFTIDFIFDGYGKLMNVQAPIQEIPECLIADSSLLQHTHMRRIF